MTQITSKRTLYVQKQLQVDKMKNDIKLLTGAGAPAIETQAVANMRVEFQSLRSARNTLAKEYGDLTESGKEIVEQYTGLHNAYRDANRQYRNAFDMYEGTETPTIKREFIMKCGADECRGFLSTAYKCGTCDVWTCPDCLVVIGKDKNAEHACKPDMVESAKAIKAETQPCPKCAARIYKVDGCDQMWCTVEGCNTAFSWKSGHVVTGTVHNPHYYEWLRRTAGAGGAPAREAGDIPCGGIPNFWVFMSSFRAARILPEESSRLELIHQNLADFEARLVAYPTRMPQLLNKEINVMYLMNKMSEAEWKRQLEFTEAKFNRKKEIGQILQTLVTAGADYMSNIVNRCNAATTPETRIALRMWIIDTVIPELEGLRAYTNQAFKELAVRNHMAAPQVSDGWVWMPIRALYRTKKVAAGVEVVGEAGAEVADVPPPLVMPEVAAGAMATAD